MDIDGIQGYAVSLLKFSPDLRSALQERFQHILVDEFQDVSIPQLELVKLLHEGRSNGGTLMAVGDPKQSIYGFRGAHPDVSRLAVAGCWWLGLGWLVGWLVRSLVG